jgi:integrase/recombinase XerD
VVERNPVEDTFAIRRPRKIPDCLALAEQERVLVTLRMLRATRARHGFALVATGLLTGLRVSELAALKIEDVHFEDGYLKVVNGKGHKQRLVPVIPWLRDVLVVYLRDVRPQMASAERTPFVFVSPQAAKRGEPSNTRVLYYIIRRLVAPIIGRRCGPHMLRHSYATRLLALGADLESIRSVMGHANLSTTGIYLHIPTEVVKQKIAGWLTGNLDTEARTEPLATLVTDPQPDLDAVAQIEHEMRDRATKLEPPPRMPFDRARREMFRRRRMATRGRRARSKGGM